MARTPATDIAHIAVERSTGNVFADLGFDEPDLELAKALISAKIATEVRSRGWTQTEAAAALGLDQPLVSRLIRGETGQLGLEKMLEVLGGLNFDISISLTRRDTPTRGRVLVTV